MGHVQEITFTKDTYVHGGSLAITMDCSTIYGYEPYGILTVNLEDFPCEGNKAFIDVNNMGEDIVDWLIENDLGELTGRIAFSGYCIYPEFKFNLEEINKHLTEETTNEQL